MVEIEQRFKVADAAKMVETLANEHVVFTERQTIIDKWFIPTSLHSRADHDRWFDVDHGVAYRIRHTEKSDGTVSLVLDSKQHTEASNHNTFREEVIMQDDEAAMHEYLKEQGYYNWLTINKTRQKFESPRSELIISMDTITGVKADLGIDTVLEIEYEGEATRDEALATLNEFAAMLGLTEDDLFEKSLRLSPCGCSLGFGKKHELFACKYAFLHNVSIMMNQKGFSAVILLVIVLAAGAILAASFFAYRAEDSNKTAGGMLVEKSYCSDVCPQQTRTFKVYKDIKNQTACDAIGGQTIKDAGFGGFIGCRPRPSGAPTVIKG